MKSKTTGILALIVTIATYIWVTGVLLDVILNGSVDTFEHAIAYVSNPNILFYVNYMNVSLLTIFTSMLFASIYEYFKKSLYIWATIGILFVPIYCTLNLIAYLSQITIVPRVLELADTVEYQTSAQLLAGLLVQNWDGSAISVINLLAYALLGIPSIIYGSALLMVDRIGSIAGSLLVLSGAASILAFVGVILQNSTLASMTLVSGFIYAVALIFITIFFLKLPNTKGQ
jgi:hypothetical protein